MLEIHDKQLWLGNAGDARAPSDLFAIGIRAVVDVAYEEPIAQLPRDLIYCRFPLNDGGGNDPAMLRQAVQTTVDLLSSRTPTLIACSAGMSRSPTIAANALAVYLSDTPENVLASISKQRTLGVNGELWNAVGLVLPDVRRYP